MRYLLFIYISLLTTFAITARAQEADTVCVYFLSGDPYVNKQIKTKLNVIYPYIGPGTTIDIVGYVGNPGNSNADEALSQKRAQGIAAYLVKLGVNKSNISTRISRDDIFRDKNKAGSLDFDRRVDLIIYEKVIPERKTKTSTELTIASVRATEVGETLNLEKLFFSPARHKVLESSEPVLAKLYEAMHNIPTLKIQIEGHVCCTPSYMDEGIDIDTGDLNLSEARAKYVYDYLISRGISADRLSYKGFGSTQLVKGSSLNDIVNRRVEIRIMEK